MFATSGGWSGKTLWRRRQSGINVKQVREKKPGCYLEKSIAVREKSVPGEGRCRRCVRKRARLLWPSRGSGGSSREPSRAAGGRRADHRGLRPLREESFDVHFKRK